MAHLTQHKIDKFYKNYKEKDITFNKNIISVTKLIPSEIYLKCGSQNYPCILNSSSMMGARIILQADSAFFEQLNSQNKKVSLRYAFKRSEKSGVPLTFFIKSKVEAFNPFSSTKPNLYFLTLIYSQKPPDDLIEILGRILDVHANAKRRKDERIVITKELQNELHMKSNQGAIVVGDQKKSCIIRDLSFFGAKIIVAGNKDSQCEVPKPMKMVIQFNEDPPGNCLLTGDVVRCDVLKDRNDFMMLGIKFDEKQVPLAYTQILNEYLSTRKRVKPKGDEKDAEEAEDAEETEDVEEAEVIDDMEEAEELEPPEDDD